MKTQVVLLSSKSPSIVRQEGENLIITHLNSPYVFDSYDKKHLYCLSDNPIKAGDYFLCFSGDLTEIKKSPYDFKKNGDHKKIEATTDRGLIECPKLAFEWLQLYVKTKFKTLNIVIEHGVAKAMKEKLIFTRDEVQEIISLYESIMHGDFHVMTKDQMRSTIEDILNPKE